MRSREALPQLRRALLERLMHYYQFIGERHGAGQADTFTSREIADLVLSDDTLVRKDLAAIGVRGIPRKGFRTEEVLAAIRRTLGFDQDYRAALIGVGRLGGALASYEGFAPFGLEICALFDSAPAKIGRAEAGLTILPLELLAPTVRHCGITMAILAVPADEAQEVAQQALDAGIRAIWNFASTPLVVPPDVFVRHERIAVGLAELSHFLKRCGRKGT